MDAYLLVLSGARAKRLPLKLPTIIGRSDDSGLRVKAAAISRRHCELYEFEGELAVKDLGSSNGTFVNDERIDAPAFLSPADELRIGGVTFRADYELPDGHKSEVAEEIELPAEEDDVHAEEIYAEDASHVEMHETGAGSFISIDTEAPSPASADDEELDQFLKGLD